MGGTGLSKAMLIRLYTKLGKTDKEIAEFMDLDRTTIVHARKKFGVETRQTSGHLGEKLVISKLKRKGFKVRDMNLEDKTSLYDLKVDDHIRIEVKTARIIENRFNFQMANKKEARCIPSEHRIVLPTGRTMKVYRKTCDFVIFVGLAPNKVYYYIVPSEYVEDGKQSVYIPSEGKHKYKEFEQDWNLIKNTNNSVAN